MHRTVGWLIAAALVIHALAIGHPGASSATAADQLYDGNFTIIGTANNIGGYGLIDDSFYYGTPVAGWQTTATDGLLEIWENGFLGVPAPGNSTYFAEMNANQVSSLYQIVTATTSSPFDVYFSHRGRDGVDTAGLSIIGIGSATVWTQGAGTLLYQTVFSGGNSAWSNYSASSIALPTVGQNYAMVFDSISASGGSAAIGNLMGDVRFGSGVSVSGAGVTQLSPQSFTPPYYTPPTVTYWAPAAGVGGDGTWVSGSNAFWAPNSDGSGTKQLWNNGQAIFSGSAGTVTVSGTVQANQMRFTTSGYTIAGDRINFLGTPSVQLGSGVSTTVTANLGGSGPLSITGTGSRGTLALSGNVAVGEGIQVTNALVSLSGTVSGNVSLAANAALGGSGVISGVISGAGLVAPGNSPGILTAQAVDPSTGLDFTFEFSGTAPNYASGTASVNDVLRLTGETPFLASLTGANTKTLFLNMTEADLGLGVVLKGAFFTDADSDFLSLINNAIWDNAGFAVYVKGNGLGTDNSYNGQGYYNWRNPAMFGWTQSLFASTSVETANFAGGSSTGRVLTLTVAVPEPSTYAMALAGLACGGFSMWRRRKRA